MTTYNVISRESGEKIFTYEADAPVYWQGMEADICDHVALETADDLLPPVTIYGGRRTISRLEFLSLMTAPERIAIREAAKVSPILDDYMRLLDASSEVDLDSVTTAGGINTLEAVGILATGRAVEILNG